MTNLLAGNPVLRRFDPAVLTAFGCIIVLLLIGSLINENFLSPEYLLQQLQVGAFLALISTGMMIVILLGQIDLSVPWIITVGGMMSTAAAGWGDWGPTFAIPVGILCGLIFGLINGIGVAYLRVPSMIFTLGINAVAQGFMIVRTGGFAPQDMATESMHEIATGRLVFGIPNPVWVWVAVGAATVFLLRRTVFGRAVYAIGNNQTAALFSGIRVGRVKFVLFLLTGLMSGVAAICLTSRLGSTRPSIALGWELEVVTMVVLGGVNILGGSGTIPGVVIAAVIMGMVTFGFGLLNVPGIVMSIFIGLLLILVIGLPIVWRRVFMRRPA